MTTFGGMPYAFHKEFMLAGVSKYCIILRLDQNPLWLK